MKQRFGIAALVALVWLSISIAASSGAQTPTPTRTPAPVYCPAGSWCLNPTTGQCLPSGPPLWTPQSCGGGWTCVTSCPSVTPTPTATQTPSITPTPTPSPLLTVTLDTAFSMGNTYGWYAPDCKAMPLPWPGITGIAVTDPYWCTPTDGDRIMLQTSTDGHEWTMRQPIFTAIPGTWEMDGNGPWNGTGYPTGISNFAVTQSRYDGHLIAAYTAGTAPNNAAVGGIGLAFSGDGITWRRYAGNPIARLPWEFVQRFVRLPNGLFLYVNGTDGSARIAIDEHTPNSIAAFIPTPLPGLQGTMLGYDYDGCLTAQFSAWDETVGFVGPVSIYRGGDCVSTPGTLVATFKPTDFGHKGIAGISLVEQEYEGGLLGGPSVLVALGDSWGAWKPYRLLIGPQKALVQPPTIWVPTVTPTPGAK